MEYIVEIVVGLLMAGITIFGFKKVSKMEDKLVKHETEISVNTAKIETIEGNSKDIKSLLKEIANDLGEIKAEQGYWRGRQERQS